jgi:sugar phosphate isomerase/epimerase
MPPRIGVMMYTVLEQAKADLEGTLARIAELGFLGVETYGLLEHYPAARVKRAIGDAGLELTSAHAPFPSGPEATRILDENAELGATTLVWSLEREEFDTPEAIAAGLVRVNDGAENAAKYGMRIGYHNHFAEFSQVFDGRKAYDLLLEQLDPRVVIELDMYWCRMGGADPAAVVAALGDRVKYVHIKDGPAVSYEDDVMVPIGEGAIDWDAALTANPALDWHLLELERLHVDTFEAVEQSYDYLVSRGLSRGTR